MSLWASALGGMRRFTHVHSTKRPINLVEYTTGTAHDMNLSRRWFRNPVVIAVLAVLFARGVPAGPHVSNQSVPKPDVQKVESAPSISLNSGCEAPPACDALLST